MLQFINPIWLAGGLGVIIPVIIHLWNIRKGKVLRVGSTMLMAEATQQTSSSLRISQWLLLALRCLLILSLAMLFAGPEWHLKKQQRGKGWILIDKKDFSYLYMNFKSAIDSLAAKGFELHAADASLETLHIADSLDFAAPDSESDKTPDEDGNAATSAAPASPPGSASVNHPVAPVSSDEGKLSYWSVLARADQALPAGYPVYFFSHDMLAAVTGEQFAKRPVVSIDLRWQMAGRDSTFNSIPLAARQLEGGGYELSSLQPGRGGNTFIKNITPVPSTVYPLADTATQQITIYHNKYPEDLRYLQAAIRAIGAFGQYKFKLQIVDQRDRIAASQDWIFWLSNEPISANLPARNVFCYQPGKALATNTWIANSDGPVNAGAIEIYQRVPGKPANNVLWKDGFGNPLLTLETIINSGETKQLYRFYSRFHPGWSDLGWDPSFPKLLLPLMIDDVVQVKAEAYNYAIADVADVLPTVVQETYKENKSTSGVVDLKNWFWLIAFILFAAERLISLNQSIKPK